MESYLFGSGVPKIVAGTVEFSIEKSFIESIELEPREYEHESIINASRNWVEISHYDHLMITILCRLHKKTTEALVWFKNFYDTYNKTEIDAFYPSQNAEAFSDAGGTPVKFRLQITELFPLESPWAYDNFRLILRSKKPVNLGALNVNYEKVAPTDTDGLLPSDTDEVIPTN